MTAESAPSPMRPIVAIVDDAEFGRSLVVPGFVSAHSHGFQRGLRGKTQRAAGETGTFWSWRDAMYALADSLTPESLYAIARQAFAELARAGVVAVGEFHYVHHQPGGTPYGERTLLADTVIEAALAEGLSIALLRVAYARAGADRALEGAQRRFCDASCDDVLRDVETLRSRWRDEPRVRVGIAPHSVRAVPRAWLTALGAHARTHDLPMHMHVAEQLAEVDACVAEHGMRPVELLAECGVLSERFCAVHATNVSVSEARLLGEHGASACICPTTERDLGDGLADLGLLRSNGVRLCVGVDSHVLSDHVEELRALETHERLRLRRRVTFAPGDHRTLAEQLLLEASANGAAAIGHVVRTQRGTTSWAPSTLVPLDQHALRGVADEYLPDALVFSGTGLRFGRRLE